MTDEPADQATSEAKFIREFITKPQSGHFIEPGLTGGGKTQGLYYLVDHFSTHTEDTVAWFDTGKSSEILKLAELSSKPIRLLIPDGLDVILPRHFSAGTIEKKFFHPLNEVWELLQPKAINVVSLTPFIWEPTTWSSVFARVFWDLQMRAHTYDLPVPLDLFVDEMQDICPSKAIALGGEHYKSGLRVAMNLFKLRSLNTRFVGATQGWTNICGPARRSFTWIMSRRGAYYERDQSKLFRFNNLFEKLDPSQAVMCWPNKWFPGIWRLPFYGDGDTLGRVRYHGILEEAPEKKKRKKKKKDEDEEEE